MIITFRSGGLWGPLVLAACCLLNHLYLSFHIQLDLMVAKLGLNPLRRATVTY